MLALRSGEEVPDHLHDGSDDDNHSNHKNAENPYRGNRCQLMALLQGLLLIDGRDVKGGGGIRLTKETERVFKHLWGNTLFQKRLGTMNSCSTS
jgi:hypothetical protein